MAQGRDGDIAELVDNQKRIWVRESIIIQSCDITSTESLRVIFRNDFRLDFPADKALALKSASKVRELVPATLSQD